MRKPSPRFRGSFQRRVLTGMAEVSGCPLRPACVTGIVHFAASIPQRPRFAKGTFMKLLAVLFVCLFAFGSALAADAGKRRPLTLDDMFRFQRVADPQLSPDGRWVVYVVTTVTDKDKNQTQAHLWLAGTDGTPPRELTTVANKKDRHPRWSPDGKQILFESNRSGESQLWLIDMGGGEARQLTTIATEANNAIWSPDGKSIAFVSAVYPEYSEKPFAESNEAN